MASSKKQNPPDQRLADLVYEGLETELGGVEIYRTALSCAEDVELRAEWQKYLEQTERHVRVLRDLCGALDLDPEQDTPGRQVVRTIGKSLVGAMHLALGSVPRAAAQVVAAECVTLAETKDHLNWSLLASVAEAGGSGAHAAIAAAVAEVEDEEDEHLYHTMGWARELHVQALGLPAQLPPPEEEKDVKSAMSAAKTRMARKKELKKQV
jgi:hypothetical protein